MEAVEVTQITASNFLSNTASVGGGGASFRVPTLLAASEPVQSALSDGVVVEEVAPSGFIAVPRFEVSGSSFTGNVVGTGSGGGLLTNLPTQVTGSAFTGNTAQVDGGGIQATNLLTVTGSQFNGNRAVTRDGGGINSTAPSANSPATLSSGNLFQSNRTGRLGGGARFSGNSSGDQFLDNVSASEAGGLMSTSNLTITRGIFLRNRSNLSGALAVDLPNTRGTLRVTNSLFARNIYTTGTGAADMRLFDLNATLLHNTFADGVTVAGVGSLILFRTDLDARNNIFANYNVSVTPGQTATAVLDTNVLFNAPAAVSPAITNTNPITGDPAFANAAANDYHIGFASSARNAGLNVGVTSDFDGQPRPIGPKPDVGFDEAIFVPPTAAPGGPYNGVEGAPVALNGSGSTDDGTITTWAWDCTDNGTLDVTSSSPTGSTCTYPDNGSFALRLRVTDATGESGEATASVTIANGTPVVTPAAAQSAQVGAAKSVALGSFTDPGPDAPWAVTVNWGDGSTDTAFSANAVGALAAQSHTWATAGNFTVTVNVRDKDNATGTATFAVGVAAAPPGPNDDDFFLYLPTIQR
jgi:predicted outer membrane repeat protein